MARARASLAFWVEFTPVHCPLLHVLLSSVIHLLEKPGTCATE